MDQSDLNVLDSPNMFINFIHGWLNRQWWSSKPVNYDIIPTLSVINTVCRQSNCYSAVSLYMVGLGIQYSLVLTHARNGVRSWKFVRKYSHFASHVRCRWSVYSNLRLYEALGTCCQWYYLSFGLKDEIIEMPTVFSMCGMYVTCW